MDSYYNFPIDKIRERLYRSILKDQIDTLIMKLMCEGIKSMITSKMEVMYKSSERLPLMQRIID